MGDMSFSEKAKQSRLWNPYLQKMPRKELDAMHLRRIQKLLKYAYDNTPMYRKLYDKVGLKPEDVKTWDDFYYKVPFTDKPDYLCEQAELDDQLMIPSRAGHTTKMSYYHQTSGTTGEPLREGYSLKDYTAFAECYAPTLWQLGIGPDDRAYFPWDFTMFMGLWSIYYACLRMGVSVYSGGGLDTKARVKQIFTLNPTMLIGTPTYILHIVEVAGKMGLDLRKSSVRIIGGGGEAGLGLLNVKNKLLEAFNAEIVWDAYGMSEIGVHPECPEHPSEFHVMEEWLHSYSIDTETGKPLLEDGQVGENIVTSYSHSFQPFIKYRSHDLVRRYRHKEHRCGWTWEVLEGGVLGRTDQMVTIRGVNVYPTAVGSILSQTEGVSIHYELHVNKVEEMDHMTIKFEVIQDFPADSYHLLEEKIAFICKEKIGVRFAVEAVAPGSLPRYEIKSKRFFDHRH